VLRYVEYIPTAEYTRFRNFLQVSRSVGKKLVDQKVHDILLDDEKGKKDIMSILGIILSLLLTAYFQLTVMFVCSVQSNMSEEAKRRLDEDEVLSQMS
jgi:hypothetical protein